MSPIQKLCSFIQGRGTFTRRGMRSMEPPALPEESMTYADALEFALAFDERLNAQMRAVERLVERANNAYGHVTGTTYQASKILADTKKLVSDVNTQKLQQDIVDSINRMQIRTPNKE